jgi:hypothetical protein
MKKEIKTFLLKYLAKLGFRLGRFPKQDRLCKRLEYTPLRRKERKMRRTADFLKKANYRDYYENILKYFVPNWNINMQEAQFVGQGYSLSGLNTYRKVRIKDKLYFEKIYFNSHQELHVSKWVQKHLYEIIKDKIKIPRIEKIYPGEVITIVYTEFFQLLSLEEEAMENRLIGFSKDLYCLTHEYEEYISGLEIPVFIKNFRKHFQYESYSHLAERKLRKQNIAVESIETRLNDSKNVLTHSDIYWGNGFKNNILIDWDSFGFYPFGFDPAFIYSRLHLKNNKEDNSLEWLNKNYEYLIPSVDWPEFKRNFSYFLFIFSMEYLMNNELFIEQQLIENIKKQVN